MVTERSIALYLRNNHFCLIWESEKLSLDKVSKKLKDNFEIVNNFITEENNSSHFKYEFIPKKIDSHPTIFIVYDLETHNTDKTRPYCISFLWTK